MYCLSEKLIPTLQKFSGDADTGIEIKSAQGGNY